MNKENKLSAKELKLISGGQDTLNELKSIEEGNKGINMLNCCGANEKPCTSIDVIACSTNSTPPSTKGCK